MTTPEDDQYFWESQFNLPKAEPDAERGSEIPELADAETSLRLLLTDRPARNITAGEVTYEQRKITEPLVDGTVASAQENEPAYADRFVLTRYVPGVGSGDFLHYRWGGPKVAEWTKHRRDENGQLMLIDHGPIDDKTDEVYELIAGINEAQAAKARSAGKKELAADPGEGKLLECEEAVDKVVKHIVKDENGEVDLISFIELLSFFSEHFSVSKDEIINMFEQSMAELKVENNHGQA